MKRLIDQRLWEDAWFFTLPSLSKLAWIYIITKVEPGGIWKANHDLADSFLGSPVDWVKFREACGDRVRPVPGRKDYWWIPKWIHFQVGALNYNPAPSQGSMKAQLRELEAYGLLEEYKKTGLPYIDLSEKAVTPAPRSSSGGPDPRVGMPDGLRHHPKFFKAWGDWLDHLSQNGKTLSNQTKHAIWVECERNGPGRAVVCIEYSIRKGWKNIAWDAPRAGEARGIPSGDKFIP